MADTENPVETTTVVVAEEKGPKNESPPPNNILKYVSGFLMMLTFILCIPIMAAVIWLFYVKDNGCEELLGLPKLQIGVCVGLIFVILTSIAAIILRSRLPMVGVILALLPLLIMLVVGVTFIGTKMGSRSKGSPLWIKTRIENDIKWNAIKTCLYDSQTCQEMAILSLELNIFDSNARKLTPIESGCCQPPSFCEMEAMNATFWMKKDNNQQRNRDHPFDTDCDRYNNDRNILCYDCQSCRQGYFTTLENKWKKLGVFIVCITVLLIVSQVSMFLATVGGRVG